MAKQRGVYKDRKTALIQAQVDEIKARLAQDDKKLQIARNMHIRRKTLYKHLRQDKKRSRKNKLRSLNAFKTPVTFAFMWHTI